MNIKEFKNFWNNSRSSKKVKTVWMLLSAPLWYSLVTIGLCFVFVAMLIKYLSILEAIDSIEHVVNG